jgi:hypothetical protein
VPRDKFGLLVAARGSVRNPRPRRLEEVRIYTGMPSSSKEPKTNAAHKRQRRAWEEQGVKVVARPLRYPKGWPAQKAIEKGVDVAGKYLRLDRYPLWCHHLDRRDYESVPDHRVVTRHLGAARPET